MVRSVANGRYAGRVQIDPEELVLVVKRLRRAQGQIGGIVAMIESGRECEDIVTQIAAVKKAIDRAGFQTISTGLRQCAANPDPDSVDVAKLERLFLALA